MPHTDGSAEFSMGNTSVIAFIQGPREPTHRHLIKPDKCAVSCEFRLESYAMLERTVWTQGSRRARDFELCIKRTFENAILTGELPRSEVHIVVQVHSADGSLLACCINAASLALLNAGVPMKDIVGSCTCGFLNASAVVDLNSIEYASGGPELTVASFLNSGDIVLLDMKSKLVQDHFEEVLELGLEGSKIVASEIKRVCVASI